MPNRNKTHRKYVDMIVGQRAQTISVKSPITIPKPTSPEQLTDVAIAEIALEHRKHVLGKRIRRVAKIMIVATKTGASYKQRQHAKYIRMVKQPLQLAGQNSLRVSAAAVLMVFTLVAVFGPLLQAKTGRLISLSDASRKLVGNTRDDADKYLTFDAKTQSYNFAAPQQDKTASYNHSGRNADAYNLTLPKKANEGISITDNATKIAATFTPQFFTTQAEKTDQNNLVYRSGSRQMVYTLKYNGLKEDIIIPNYQSENLKFSYRLSLPVGVEARLEDNGTIGIYSSDPSLFGDISFGSEADQAKVEKARQSGDKTNLVMTIPFPVVKDVHGNEYSDRSVFELGDHKIEKRSANTNGSDTSTSLSTFNTYQLSVSAWNLKQLTYPISIDPTMRVTTSADFNAINQEGGSDIDTANNLIKRSSLSGGSLASWAAPSSGTTAIPAATYENQFVTANGYVYSLTGTANSKQVEYATIDATTGVIGTFAQASLLNVSHQAATMVTYNGYIYVIGGVGSGTNPPGITTVEYAKIKSDGSLSAWQTTSPLNTARYWNSGFAYNGYLYTSGGCPTTLINNCGSYTNTVEYAQIKSDGTLATWQSTSPSFTTARASFSFTVNNGYAYVIGGYNGGGLSDVQSAAINSNGSLSNWTTLSSTPLPAARFGQATVIKSGYIYILGGITAYNTTYNNTAYYAALNNDGTIGNWLSASGFSTGRILEAAFNLGDKIYIAGGCSADCSVSANWLSDIQYTTLKAGGSLGSTSTTSSGATSASVLPFAGAGIAAAVDNGFLYIAGGQTATGYNNHVYHTLLNSDGTFSYPGNGANSVCVAVATVWCDDGVYTGAPLLDGFAGSNMVIQNHCMYLIGGVNGTSTTANVYIGGISFSGSLNNTDSNDGQVKTSTMVTATNSPTARAYGTVTNYQGFLLYAGGVNGTTYSTLVQQTNLPNSSSCTVNNLSSWTTNANMTSPRAYHSSYRVQNHIFYMGGYSAAGNNTLSSGDDVNLGTSNVGVTNALDAKVAGAGFAEASGNFYLVGGTTDNSTNPLDNHVRRLSIGSTSQPASANWVDETPPAAPLPQTGINRNAVVTANGFLYSLGGCTAGAANATCTSFTSSIYVSSINNGGTGSVSTSISPVTYGARRASTGFASNGYFYTVGGCPANSDCSSTGTPASMMTTVSYTKLNSDGTLNDCTGSSTWCDLTGVSNGVLPECRNFGPVLSKGNYIYYFGGISDCSSGAATQNVLYAAVDPVTGALSKPNASCSLHNASTSTVWCDSATLPTGYSVNDAGHKHAAVYGNNFYLFDPANANIAYISQNPATGELVTPTSCGATFSGTLYCQTPGPLASVGYHDGPLIAYSGRLYVIGGSDALSNIRNDSAVINSDGSLGTWRKETKAPFSRNASQAAIVDGYVYSFFGFDTNDTMVNCYRGILKAPILADGSIGQWQAVLQNTLVGQASGEAMTVGHKIYSFNGGCGAPVTAQSPHILTPKTIPRVAQFSKLYDFDSGVKPTKLITRGTKQTGSLTRIDYSSSNNASTTLDTAQTVTDIGYTGANAQTINLGTNRTLSRYLFLHYIIDDSLSATFPDSSQSNITDFDMYFIANPGARLKGGRTFTNGVDRGLDAQPQ